jgi:TatD DNase family protein
MKEALDKFDVEISTPADARIFDIGITLRSEKHTAYVRICDTHTNLVCIKKDEVTLYDNPPKDVQKDLFHRQLVLADELGLPVVLHSRDAAQETLEFLREHKDLLKKGGLMHCYSYSAEMTADFIALGLTFSFGGPSTFKNGKKAQECIQRIPAHLLLSETDCPYLTPVPYRGTFPNEPKNVKYVVDNMAELLGENLKELKDTLMQNAKTLFFKLK